MARLTIVLFAALVVAAIALPVEKNEVIIDDMIMTQELLDAIKNGRNGLVSRKWPTNVIPIFIDPSYTPEQFEHIFDAIVMIAVGGCINFVEYNPTVHANWIHIRPQSAGAGICSAQLGFVGGYQYINVPVVPGRDCFTLKGTVAHEILHALGYAHMHQTATRDSNIRMLWENIPENIRSNFDIWEDSTLKSTQYDFGSVLHYGQTAGTTGGAYAFEPIVTVPPGVQIGQRSEVSEGDHQRLRDIYCPSGVKSSHAPLADRNAFKKN